MIKKSYVKNKQLYYWHCNGYKPDYEMLKEMMLLKLNGCTYKEIGDKYNLSRQRIQQILSPSPLIREYIVVKHGGLCVDCGKDVGMRGHLHHNSDKFDDYKDVENIILLCNTCHRHRHKR